MKAQQPVLTTAVVAVLAVALLVGHSVLQANQAGLATTATDQVLAQPVDVPRPNARAGSELERLEHPEDVVSTGLSRNDVPRPRANTATELQRLEQPVQVVSMGNIAQNDAAHLDMSEDDFLAALDQDLDPWERTSVEIGGALGPQKSAALIASEKRKNRRRSDNGASEHQQQPADVASSSNISQNDAAHPDMSEDDFMAALDQSLDPWERTRVEIGGALGPQKSAALIASEKRKKRRTTENGASEYQEQPMEVVSMSDTPQNDAAHLEMSEDEFLAALDQDLDPWERTPVEIGGALGPQKSAALIASESRKRRRKSEDDAHQEKPVSKNDAAPIEMSEDDLLTALDQDLDPWERTPVEIGGALGPQKSVALIASETHKRKRQSESDAAHLDVLEEDFFSALDQDVDPWERNPVEIGGALGPQKSAVLIAKSKSKLVSGV